MESKQKTINTLATNIKMIIFDISIKWDNVFHISYLFIIEILHTN